MPRLFNVLENYKNNCLLAINESQFPNKYFEGKSRKSMNDSEIKNTWFKNWVDYHKLDMTSESLCSQDENISSVQLKNNKTHIPLNQLLDNIPLAYSPVTKQLHVLTPELHKNTLQKSNCQLFDKEGYEYCNGNLEVGNEKSLEFDESNNSEKSSAPQNCSNETSQEANSAKLFQTLNQSSSAHCSNDNKNCGKVDFKNSDESALSMQKNSNFNVTSTSNIQNFTFNDQNTNTARKLSIMDKDDLSIRSSCSCDSESVCNESSKFFENGNGNGNAKEKKRKGFSAFFSRNVFGWKPNTYQGWKIFGKNFVQDTNLCSENESQSSLKSSPSSVKKYEDVIISSSALILHNRPANLPAKSLDEQQRHLLEYEQMVEAAKKKEVKESKKKKKQLQEQLKFEEELTITSKIWTCEILPKWETMKNAKRTRDLWWAGLPPSIRGKIWKLAVKNELNITYQLYEICAARAQERLKNVELNPGNFVADDANKESSVELIQLDISRTFPQLCIFQKGGPYYDILHCLLGAYVCYRPDVGYVQGMSFIAAVLILNLEPADAFICFANLLNRPCHLAFFTLNQSFMNAYYKTYDGFFKENLPKLCQHFEDSCLTPDLYLLDWVYSVFAKAMPLDIACRVWDVFLRDGEEFLFRTALGILHLHQDKLLKLDFINGAQFLRKLPDDLSADLLFKSIDSIKMCVGKVKFGQILANFIEKCSTR